MDTATNIIHGILQNWWDTLPWVLGFAALFSLLFHISPCNPEQRFQPRAFVTDMGYYFIIPFFDRIVSTIYLGLGVLVVYRGVPQDQLMNAMSKGYGPLNGMPIWLQAAIIFIVSDIILYWTHRLFHTSSLWPFHAIHHSSTAIDWHTTYRFHPVNVWLTFTLVDTIMLFTGFSLEAVTLMSVVNLLYSAMVHSNLNWTFGPFRYVFSSPVFHRWHHTTQERGLNKNFAPTFPLIDIVFGTFYMPEGELPKDYGIIGGKVPETFIGQLIYPFKKR